MKEVGCAALPIRRCSFADYIRQRLALCVKHFEALPPHPNVMKAREIKDDVDTDDRGIYLVRAILC